MKKDNLPEGSDLSILLAKASYYSRRVRVPDDVLPSLRRLSQSGNHDTDSGDISIVAEWVKHMELADTATAPSSDDPESGAKLRPLREAALRYAGMLELKKPCDVPFDYRGIFLDILDGNEVSEEDLRKVVAWADELDKQYTALINRHSQLKASAKSLRIPILPNARKARRGVVALTGKPAATVNQPPTRKEAMSYRPQMDRLYQAVEMLADKVGYEQQKRARR